MSCARSTKYADDFWCICRKAKGALRTYEKRYRNNACRVHGREQGHRQPCAQPLRRRGFRNARADFGGGWRYASAGLRHLQSSAGHAGLFLAGNAARTGRARRSALSDEMQRLHTAAGRLRRMRLSPGIGARAGAARLRLRHAADPGYSDLPPARTFCPAVVRRRRGADKRVLHRQRRAVSRNTISLPCFFACSTAAFAIFTGFSLPI